MKTILINGREYRLREDLRLTTQLRIAKAQDIERVLVTLHEVLCDMDGEQYADVDAMADHIFMDDFADLFVACCEHLGVKHTEDETPPDPLPLSKNSGSD